MPAAVLDRFSSIFGEGRGLPESLCKRRRSEELRTDDSLINVLAEGKHPVSSILVAGASMAGKSAVCHQLLARLIDQGDSCLMACSTEAQARSAWSQVMRLVTSQDPNVEDLLNTFVAVGDKRNLALLLGEVRAYDVVYVDTLDELVAITGGSLATTLAGLWAEARKWKTRLIAVKRTQAASKSSWRQQLQSGGLLTITDHVGAVTRESASVLMWDGGYQRGKGEVTPLYLDAETHTVSPHRYS